MKVVNFFSESDSQNVSHNIEMWYRVYENRAQLKNSVFTNNLQAATRNPEVRFPL